MNRRLALAGIASALLAVVSVGSRVVETQTGPSCAAAKKKIAGKKDQKLLTCDSAAIVKGVTPDPDCQLKARNTFSAAWDKAEAKGGCFTTNDKNTIEGKVDAHVQDLESTLHVTGSTPSKCSSKKFKDAGKKGLCLLLCHGKAQRWWAPTAASVRRTPHSSRTRSTASTRTSPPAGTCARRPREWRVAPTRRRAGGSERPTPGRKTSVRTHPQYCFDTNISSCGPVCTKTAGVACGPDSHTCGGP